MRMAIKDSTADLRRETGREVLTRFESGNCPDELANPKETK
jgi:hypothetical protein